MSGKHWLWMVIGCVLPMGAAAAVIFFDIPISRVALFGLMLLCPLSHLLMMKGMMGGQAGHEHGQEGYQPVHLARESDREPAH